MTSTSSLIDELESALASGTNAQRIQALSRVTDLFMTGAATYTDEQVGIFDDVILKIAERIEAKALAKLASMLAPIDNAPPKVMRTLAFHDDIEIAHPVLSASERLNEADLVANARTKSQLHLLAISERRALSEAVTDVLVERGDQKVVRSVAKNRGARFSDAGLRMLVKRASGDDVLATQVGMRRDLPPQHFLKLIEKASAAVRERLLAANPEAAAAVRDVLADVVGGIRSEVRSASQQYSAAMAEVEALRRAKRLGEEQVYQFARDRKFEETAVALSLLCGVPIDVVEQALLDTATEIALILAKVADLSWTTAKAILLMQVADRGMSAQDLERAMQSYGKLQQQTARRVLGFYHARRRGTAESVVA
jgi:uncharacterized protein (DUF2336 family)